MTPREHRGRPRTSAGVAVAGSAGAGVVGSVSASARANKNSVGLENMPERRLPSMRDGPLAVLKALGDDTRYAIYLELAASHRRRSAPASSPTGSACTPTRCARTSTGCARPAWSTSRPMHRGTVGRPAAPLLARARRAVARLRAAGAHAARRAARAPLAERVGADADDAAEIGAQLGRRRSAAAPARRSCVKALAAELDRLGFDPRVEPGDGADERRRIEFLHCPFRELAEAYPDLVCNLHRGICEGVVGCGRRGKRRRSSRRCTTRSRAT